LPDNEGQRRALVKRTWLQWFALWVLLMVIIMAARLWFSFTVLMGVLIATLAGVLLYQRYVNKRSWRSIMWGVHASDE
jgi:hypothetical protein